MPVLTLFPPLSHACFAVRLLTHFVYRNHQCLVFEMMSMNLYELLKTTQFRGFPLRVIQDFALQLLKTLCFLARDDVDIIHCDLKPENILLRHADENEIKVIDFGSSCRSNQCVYPYIQSRAYRSPEVLLGLPYTAAIDMWSLGCILVEMHTGTLLFQARDQFDQMQKMVKLLGMIPGCMLAKATDEAKTQFFQRNEGDWNWHLRQTKEVPSSPSSNAATATMAAAPVAASSPWTQAAPIIVPRLNPIASLTKIIITPGLASLYPTDASNSQRNYTLFIDLIYKMLAYDPAERIKPAEALKHPFFALGDEASTAATPTPRTTASTALVASAKPKKRKMGSPATASSNKMQEEHPPLQEQQLQPQPQPIVRNEPSIFERLRRVFR
jgi:dual specificity tyrosine-phosphorylation-regulated kinase 1